MSKYSIDLAGHCQPLIVQIIDISAFVNLTLSSSMVKHQENIWCLLLTKKKGIQIPLNTLIGRSYLYKHMYLRKPRLLWKTSMYVSPIKSLERALETVNQRSEIYFRNGINCALVQYGKKKK